MWVSSNVASLFAKILSEIEMLAYDVLRRESAPDSEGCSGAQLGGHLLIPASQTFITCTPYTTLQTRRPGMTTGTAQNVNKSCVQGTMDTSPCGHFGPQHSVLTTYNLQSRTLGSWDMARLNLVKSAIFQKWIFWWFFTRNDYSRVDLIIKVVLEFSSDL